jgi:hypothetical protein
VLATEARAALLVAVASLPADQRLAVALASFGAALGTLLAASPAPAARSSSCSDRGGDLVRREELPAVDTVPRAAALGAPIAVAARQCAACRAPTASARWFRRRASPPASPGSRISASFAPAPGPARAGARAAPSLQKLDAFFTWIPHLEDIRMARWDEYRCTRRSLR